MNVMHPWLEKYPIADGHKYLIMGTHPPMPYSATSMQFYYGNMNEFWRLLSYVYPNEQFYDASGLPDLSMIKRFLDKYRIGITDVVYITSGKPFSTDEQMEIEKLNPFLKDWLENSSIEKIFFTSFSGKNNAYSLFKKWFKSCYSSKEFKEDYCSINGRTIVLVKLYSPSPTARRGIAGRSPVFKAWKEKNPEGTVDAFRISYYKKRLPLAIEKNI